VWRAPGGIWYSVYSEFLGELIMSHAIKYLYIMVINLFTTVMDVS